MKCENIFCARNKTCSRVVSDVVYENEGTYDGYVYVWGPCDLFEALDTRQLEDLDQQEIIETKERWANIDIK